MLNGNRTINNYLDFNCDKKKGGERRGLVHWSILLG